MQNYSRKENLEVLNHFTIRIMSDVVPDRPRQKSRKINQTEPTQVGLG